MNVWAEKQLDELGYVSRGRSRHRPRDEKSLYGGIFPFIQTADVKHAEFYITSHTQTYSEKGLAQSRLWQAGTLCITIAANIADTAILAYDACFPDSIIGFIADPDICDVRFVKYFFSTVQSRYKQIAQGAAQDNLSQQKLLTLKIPTPPLATQQRIAEILSNYDRLIDNNTRRIALLEESIHRLYQEWFVYLRFPGCDRVKVVDGVPEGWRKSAVNDAFVILGGGTPSKVVQDYWQNGTINWYSPTDLTKASTMFMEVSGNQISSQGLANSSARLFPPFSVMMTSRATIGALAINTTEACTNQGFITCIPNESIPLYLLYCWLKENVGNFSNLATGTTFKEISKGVFKRIEIIVPSEATSGEFESRVKLIGNCIFNLQRQNKHLREARDLLLPRLMNGSLAV